VPGSIYCRLEFEIPYAESSVYIREKEGYFKVNGTIRAHHAPSEAPPEPELEGRVGPTESGRP